MAANTVAVRVYLDFQFENFATHYCFMLTVDIFMSSGQIEDSGKVTDGELSSAWLDH